MLPLSSLVFVTVQIVLFSGQSFSQGVCKQSPIELGIVLDTSGSIQGPNFQKIKSFLQDFLRQFDIGDGQESGVRVSLITFGSYAYPHNGFDLTTYANKDDVIRGVGKVKSLGGSTATDAGIEYMHEKQLTTGVVRPAATKIALVITDGRSDNPQKTKEAAEAARRDNITIFALGVGGNTGDKELEDIAGNQSRVANVSDYSDLNLISEELARKICIKKQIPTTTHDPAKGTPAALSNGLMLQGAAPVKVCKQNPLELGIVLDISHSIGSENFKLIKLFLQDFLRQFEIGNDGVRVSLITFGRTANPDNGFNLTSYTDKDELIRRVGEVKYLDQWFTATYAGIEYMHKQQMDESVVRPFASKAALLVTDGASHHPHLTLDAAAAALADNITIFALGIGKHLNVTRMAEMTGNSSNVIIVRNYTDLDLVSERLARQTCINTPAATQERQTKLCGELDPADIVFVFDPSTLGLDNLAWASSFIGLTAESKDMQNGFQFGVISGPGPGEGFDLDTYTDSQDIRERLKDYGRSHFEDLLKNLVDKGFASARETWPSSNQLAALANLGPQIKRKNRGISEYYVNQVEVTSHGFRKLFDDDSTGSRSNAKEVVVLVNPGPQMKGNGNIADYVRRLSAQGVQVYYADPLNKGIKIPGATSLHGGDPKSQSENLINALCPHRTPIK